MFRYAIHRIFKNGTEEYLDCGSNDYGQAAANLADISRWDETKYADIVKVKLPWDGKSIPDIIGSENLNV